VFLSSFLFLHALLIILFSIGVLAEHPYSQSKSIFIGGVLLLAVGTTHALSSSIFPQDPVGAESTFLGVMHVILVGITVVSIFVLMPLLGVGLSQLYDWQDFEIFTFLCLAVIIISGVSSPIVISKGIEVMGLTERITGYTFYVWMFVLAYLLIKEPSAQMLSGLLGRFLPG
jgi:predicted Na+-dependent transporter